MVRIQSPFFFALRCQRSCIVMGKGHCKVHGITFCLQPLWTKLWFPAIFRSFVKVSSTCSSTHRSTPSSEAVCMLDCDVVIMFTHNNLNSMLHTAFRASNPQHVLAQDSIAVAICSAEFTCIFRDAKNMHCSLLKSNSAFKMVANKYHDSFFWDGGGDLYGP